MALMQWNDTMSVDMEELDEQHKQLIALINEAYEAIQRHDEHKMSELINKMRDYAILHFETEERYLEQCDYPDIEAHKALHAKFNEDVDEFKRNLCDRTNLSQIFVFLSRWLTNHIMNEDKQYSSCIAKNEKIKK
jgi:hemerythrin